MVGALLLRRFIRLIHKRKSKQSEAANTVRDFQPEYSQCANTTEIKNHELKAQSTEVDEVETVTTGVMTKPLEMLLQPSHPVGCNKSINTSHRPHSIARPTGTLTNNASKRKIRRAQKSLEEIHSHITTERRTKVKEWRSSLTKFRNKMLQLIRNSEDKNKLAGYVFTSRMASQKDMENTAIYVRSLKEKVNHQCQQNEKMKNNILRSRPRHQY